MKRWSKLYTRSACTRHARIVEVGPRDGLQNESAQVPTAAKIAFVNRLTEAGLRHIEVTSFVSPRRVPQLADAEAVFRGIERRRGVTYTALVPNVQGLERALSVDVESVALLTAASESFNERNLGCTTRESLRRIERIVEEIRRTELQIRAYVSTAFVCPYEGDIDHRRVVEIVRELGGMGIAKVSLGDTIGAAYPDSVSRLLEAVQEVSSIDDIALHLHDTRGRALANALAGLLHGVEEFDSSAGGLGGCPFAAGAKGNVRTEKLVDFFTGQGIEVDGDRDQIASALDELPAGLRGREES